MHIPSVPDTHLPTAVSLAMTYYCFLLILQQAAIFTQTVPFRLASQWAHVPAAVLEL